MTFRQWLKQDRLRPVLVPAFFFLAVIYYEELFLKLYCLGGITPAGALFTFLFTVPIAMVLGLFCGILRPRRGRFLLCAATGVISFWMGAQIVYYRLFKTFLTIFSITKMFMVAKSFGGMAGTEILLNWFPVLMMLVPFLFSVHYRQRLVPECSEKPPKMKWLALAAAVQLCTMGVVMLCGWGTMSLRYLYTRAASPPLEVQAFGMLTQTELEIRRVLFGIKPDDPEQRYRLKWRRPLEERPTQADPLPSAEGRWDPEKYNVMDIDFDSFIEGETDEDMLAAHQWFSSRTPTEKNQYTGLFEGKNLVWIVAESFSPYILDPERTPVLWKMSHEGFVCSNFYTPLWGVSTSDGEYVTTTGLIPKSGIWSYSRSSVNWMPFSLGHQFKEKGYTTLAWHDYLYEYYDRNLSHPNMGWDYRALGHGLELESGNDFPASDREMMDVIVPEFVNEDHFAVYILTVSGHLNYNLKENAMSRKHWDEVADLPYSDKVKCYLACQMELELAMESLTSQLEAAGKLDDTVIVLSADHYPYGLTDEEYSELAGRSLDTEFEIFRSSLILWSAGMETPVEVDRGCSSLDLLPTLSNLFGLEYDSRLMMGEDIFSPGARMIVFSDYSFICTSGKYNAVTDTFTNWDGSLKDPVEAAAILAEVQNRVAYSAFILDNDYYRLILNGPPAEVSPLQAITGRQLSAALPPGRTKAAVLR